MRYHIVCVRDSAAGVYGVPNFVLSTGAAVRGFGDEVNRKAEGNVFNTHPEDFELYAIGQYDDADASFFPHSPELLVRGKDVARKGE